VVGAAERAEVAVCAEVAVRAEVAERTEAEDRTGSGERVSGRSPFCPPVAGLTTGVAPVAADGTDGTLVAGRVEDPGPFGTVGCMPVVARVELRDGATTGVGRVGGLVNSRSARGDMETGSDMSVGFVAASGDETRVLVVSPAWVSECSGLGALACTGEVAAFGKTVVIGLRSIGATEADDVAAGGTGARDGAGTGPAPGTGTEAVGALWTEVTASPARELDATSGAEGSSERWDSAFSTVPCWFATTTGALESRSITIGGPPADRRNAQPMMTKTRPVPIARAATPNETTEVNSDERRKAAFMTTWRVGSSWASSA
jgi:hypothetical protein